MVRKKLQRQREDERCHQGRHVWQNKRHLGPRRRKRCPLTIRNEDRAALASDHLVHVRHGFFEYHVARNASANAPSSRGNAARTASTGSRPFLSSRLPRCAITAVSE